MALLDMGGVLAAIGSPANAEGMSIQAKGDSRDDKRVPVPSHRHASPSAPWPWVDLDDEVDKEQLNSKSPPIPAHCLHDSSCNNCWRGYPQSRFPNWTYRQVVRSKIQKAITEYNTDEPCVLYRVDIDSDGFFSDVPVIVAEHGKDSEESTWHTLVNRRSRPTNLRVRGLFIENLSGPILQMLGTKYNIEPFFWSSSLNWIPSRFQADIRPQIGDSITLTLTFLKSTSDTRVMAGFTSDASFTSDNIGTQEIDTRAPLILYSTGKPRCLVQDLLSVHLIRNINGSTIISYHPTLNLPTTTASFLHTRVRFAGQSVYWQTIFQKSPDPTFIFLTFIWHALYAWDQATENLYDHICFLESRVMITTDIRLTRELHVIRAHQLHYTSLLDDYAEHMNFIMDSTNPMLENNKFTEQDRSFSKETLRRECHNLVLEIERLKKGLRMQQKRLTNVMDLVFSSVNIQDSKYMGKLTAANVKDSTGMQISYLTMAFLPASFAASFFGMNVRELSSEGKGTLMKYFAFALPLTALTAWIVTSFQFKGALPEGSGVHKRLAWPVYLVRKKIRERKVAVMSRRVIGVNEGVTPSSVGRSPEDEDEDDRKDGHHRGQHMNGF